MCVCALCLCPFISNLMNTISLLSTISIGQHANKQIQRCNQGRDSLYWFSFILGTIHFQECIHHAAMDGPYLFCFDHRYIASLLIYSFVVAVVGIAGDYQIFFGQFVFHSEIDIYFILPVVKKNCMSFLGLTQNHNQKSIHESSSLSMNRITNGKTNSIVSQRTKNISITFF